MPVARAVALLGISLAALVGLGGVLLAGWGLVLIGFTVLALFELVYHDTPPWFVAGIGVINAVTGLVLIAVGAVAIRWLGPRVGLPGWRVAAAVVAAWAAGAVIGIATWLECYHQSDILRLRGIGLLVVAVAVAMAAGSVGRPGWAGLVLAVPAAVVAVVLYLWLVGDSGASRCWGYSPPGVVEPPVPTTGPPPPEQSTTFTPSTLAPTTSTSASATSAP